MKFSWWSSIVRTTTLRYRIISLVPTTQSFRQLKYIHTFFASPSCRVEGMTMKLDQVFDDSDSSKGGGLGVLGSKGLEERLIRLEDRVSMSILTLSLLFFFQSNENHDLFGFSSDISNIISCFSNTKFHFLLSLYQSHYHSDVFTGIVQ